MVPGLQWTGASPVARQSRHPQGRNARGTDALKGGEIDAERQRPLPGL